jgi:flagellar motor protein MotB
MSSLKILLFVLFSFSTLNLCKATFRFEEDPLLRGKNESPLAYKARLKIHALLEGVSNKAAEEINTSKARSSNAKKTKVFPFFKELAIQYKLNIILNKIAHEHYKDANALIEKTALFAQVSLPKERSLPKLSEQPVKMKEKITKTPAKTTLPEEKLEVEKERGLYQQLGFENDDDLLRYAEEVSREESQQQQFSFPLTPSSQNSSFDSNYENPRYPDLDSVRKVLHFSSDSDDDIKEDLLDLEHGDEEESIDDDLVVVNKKKKKAKKQKNTLVIDLEDDKALETDPRTRREEIINLYTDWTKNLRKRSGLMLLEKAIEGYEDKILGEGLDEETRKVMDLQHEANKKALTEVRAEYQKMAKQEPIRQILLKKGFILSEIEKVRQQVGLNFYED